MSLYQRIERNFDHVRYLGLPVLFRHLRCRSGDVLSGNMRTVGPVHLRLADSDFAVFKQVFVHKEYDLRFVGGARQRVEDRYRAIVESDKHPVIIDAGANVGAASIWFSRVFPAASIVAIEPEPASAEILRRNVGGNPKVVVIEAALAGERGNVVIDKPGNSWGAQTVRSASGDLPAITMTDAVAAVPDGVPFIAKIDIEGFEADVFAGDTRWIDDTMLVIVEPHDWMLPGRGTSLPFQRAMGERRFEIYIAGENLMYVALGADAPRAG